MLHKKQSADKHSEEKHIAKKRLAEKHTTKKQLLRQNKHKVRSSHGPLAYFSDIFVSGKNVVFSVKCTSGPQFERTLVCTIETQIGNKSS